MRHTAERRDKRLLHGAWRMAHGAWRLPRRQGVGPPAGRREPSLEMCCRACFRAPVGDAGLPLPERIRLLPGHVEPMPRRELGHPGIAATETGVSDLLLARLGIDAAIAWSGLRRARSSK
jgi:hypothetical protein